MDGLTESMFYVLMAFHGGDMCGIDVAEYIEGRTGGRVQLGPATLYTILGKFEKEGYIREVEVEGRKRTYSITEKGREAYRQEVKRLWSCVEDAETEEKARKKGDLDHGGEKETDISPAALSPL